MSFQTQNITQLIGHFPVGVDGILGKLLPGEARNGRVQVLSRRQDNGATNQDEERDLVVQAEHRIVDIDSVQQQVAFHLQENVQHVAAVASLLH